MSKEPKSSGWQEIGLSNHAMLVAWGRFAKQIGFIEKMMKVEMKQQAREHTPQKKILEFFVAILAGYEHLKEVSQSAHPLDQDKIVAQAWGQEKWADNSGISRTLHALGESELAEFIGVMKEVSAPFIEKEVMNCLKQSGWLVYDGDLTGRPVSNQSKSYPRVAYGRMGTQIELGYQAAVVSMESPTYGRLWLDTQLHPGNRVSVTEVEAMVRAAEATTDVRPRRRLNLAQERLQKGEKAWQVAQQKYQKSMADLENLEEELAQLPQQICQAQQMVTQYAEELQRKGKEEKPHSYLAKARRRLHTYQKRLQRRQEKVKKVEKLASRRQELMLAALSHWLNLQQHVAQLSADNESNSCPIQAIFRLDAGFSSQENIAWLIEMGYEVYTKPRAATIVPTLLDLVTKDMVWQRVGANAEILTWSHLFLPDKFAYPLNFALLRYHQQGNTVYSALLHYGSTPVSLFPKQWFHDYNARQTIEAGIKEGKNIFQMHHLKVRAFLGLVLQEHFATFAANFIRWADHWLSQQLWPDSQLPQSIKDLVRVASHTSAIVYQQDDIWLLMFTQHSCYAGSVLRIGNVSFQLPLPFW